MGEHNFLKQLARVIKLFNQIRIYNTGYNRFSYDLTEKNGVLYLTVSFPSHNKTSTISYDTKKLDEFESRMKEAEAYLEEKSSLTKRYY